MMLILTSLLALCHSSHGFVTPPISSFKIRLKHNSFVPKLSPPQRVLCALSGDKSPADEVKESVRTPILYNDFEEKYSFSTTDKSTTESTTNPRTNTDDQSLNQLLRKRRKELLQDSRRLLKNWRSGKAKSFGAFSINQQYFLEKDSDLPFDWVRRVDIGKYPRVACGSAHGSIFVADVESKQILGEARGVHYTDYSDNYANALDEQLRQYIYDNYDGGGVLDVAMIGNRIVASSGREGGAKIFKLQNHIEVGTVLSYQTSVQTLIRPMPGALPIIVTCMKFDSAGRLYLGGSDGFLRLVTFPEEFVSSDAVLEPEDIDVTIIPSSTQREQPPSPILSLDISEELGLVVTAHANGNACVCSIDEREDGSLAGHVAGVWNPFAPFSRSHARSVTFVSTTKRGKSVHAIAVGGGNGEIWINEIDPNASKLFVENCSRKFEPKHVGPVISLASGPGGLVVSVGHDGILRITHTGIGFEGSKPKPLYGLGGYKVWVGSVRVDDEGKRLVSDGMDDAVVVHDFSKIDQDEHESSKDL
jgi:hypothetical protein